MEDKLIRLRQAMDSTTHQGEHFTKKQRLEIRRRIQRGDFPSNHRSGFQPLRHLIMYGFGLIAVAIFLILILAEWENPSIGPASIDISHELNMVLIAESRSEDNSTFRNDIHANRIGVVVINDPQWNIFLENALSFNDSQMVYGGPNAPSDFDMVIQQGNDLEELKLKVWIQDDNSTAHIYYAPFTPKGGIYLMEEEYAQHFKTVLKKIEEDYGDLLEN
ncbi:hypothetical protein [Evansella tamaricis]|uniref:Uncharacterized protein n=1 Tax=Evansella tamaricis TaxID=2069301 RepID=A0ABS6JDR5_9BACI|nr:hypothetical protein [Evansella tamaricis]MBU9710585.1 hypothetical protein [Evansella tamaricis]